MFNGLRYLVQWQLFKMMQHRDPYQPGGDKRWIGLSWARGKFFSFRRTGGWFLDPSIFFQLFQGKFLGIFLSLSILIRDSDNFFFGNRLAKKPQLHHLDIDHRWVPGGWWLEMPRFHRWFANMGTEKKNKKHRGLGKWVAFPADFSSNQAIDYHDYRYYYLDNIYI